MKRWLLRGPKHACCPPETDTVCTGWGALKLPAASPHILVKSRCRQNQKLRVEGGAAGASRRDRQSPECERLQGGERSTTLLFNDLKRPPDGMQSPGVRCGRGGCPSPTTRSSGPRKEASTFPNPSQVCGRTPSAQHGGAEATDPGSHIQSCRVTPEKWWRSICLQFLQTRQKSTP